MKTPIFFALSAPCGESVLDFGLCDCLPAKARRRRERLND